MLSILLNIVKEINNINYFLKHDMSNTTVQPALGDFQLLLRSLFHDTNIFSLPSVLLYFYFMKIYCYF